MAMKATQRGMTSNANARSRRERRGEGMVTRARLTRRAGRERGVEGEARMCDRREAMTKMAMAIITLRTIGDGGRANAILPGNDEEDEAFLAKARANRATRVQSEVSKEKAYVADTGLKQDENTSKIQLAVYKLSKSGAMIESGTLSDAANELSGSWVDDVRVGAKALGANGEALVDAIGALQGKCSNGDVAGAKAAYRQAAKALRALASAAGVEGKLRLL